jgi:hypothetical protein
LKPQVVFGVCDCFKRRRPEYEEDGLPLKKERVGHVVDFLASKTQRFSRTGSEKPSSISLSWRAAVFRILSEV